MFESEWTYYLQLKVVSQARRTVHPQKNGVFLLGAEPKGEPVRPGAGTLVRGPRVNYHPSITAKDISCPSWSQTDKNSRCLHAADGAVDHQRFPAADGAAADIFLKSW